MNRKDVGLRLRSAREAAGLTRDQVTALPDIKISRTTLQQWEGGATEASIETISQLAELYNVDLQTLMFDKAINSSSQPAKEAPTIKSSLDDEYVYIPAYDIKASAGHGMFTEGAESADRHLAFRKRWLSAKGLEESMLAVLFTEGDSMTPTVPEGANIVIDRRRNEAMDGKVYVIRIDDRLYVKRTQWIMNGLRLISDNKQYDPIDITKDDMEANDIEVCGQVIHAAYDLPD